MTFKCSMQKKMESHKLQEDAYMDALDAELDEIIAAGNAKAQADKADALLQKEPKKFNVSDKKYLDAIAACNKNGRTHWNKMADTKGIANTLNLSIQVTGRILKELVANGYMIVKKSGRANTFALTEEGKKLLPPPAELDSRVGTWFKNYILNHADDKETAIEVINKLYEMLDNADLVSMVKWEESDNWLWICINKNRLDTFCIMALMPNCSLATVTDNSIKHKSACQETASKYYGSQSAFINDYLKSRVDAIKKIIDEKKNIESKIYKYSFYDSKYNKNVKTKADIIQVIKDSKDTGISYYFREGYAYRGARARSVSYDEFLEKANRSWVDITVDYNTMSAEVNEFSENDMF